jgi:hypothetical protein
LPPTNIFDVRFMSNTQSSAGSLLAIIPAVIKHSTDFLIRIQSATRLVNLSWNIVDNRGQYSINIGKNKSYALIANGSLNIESNSLSAGQYMNLNIAVNTQSDNPVSTALLENYPNPFNPTTLIKLFLPSDSHVRLEVYDVVGQRVATLLNQQMQAGNHSVLFDGSQLSSGIYCVRMDTEGNSTERYTKIHRIVLIK